VAEVLQQHADEADRLHETVEAMGTTLTAHRDRLDLLDRVPV